MSIRGKIQDEFYKAIAKEATEQEAARTK